MIIQFLTSFGALLESICGIILNFFAMLFYLLMTIPTAINYILGAVGFMPPFVGSVIIVSISIAVLITVINHWGS